MHPFLDHRRRTPILVAGIYLTRNTAFLIYSSTEKEVSNRCSGAGGKTYDPAEMKRDKPAIIEPVRLRAEEYCHLTRNCAKGSAAALLEEFGLGKMEIIRGLAAAPGIAMSGGICGPVTGGLLALGLYFSSPDIMNHDTPAAYLQARVMNS